MGTAAANEEEAFHMHVEDSLALLPTLDTAASQQAQNLDIDGRLESQEFSIIDVGSGGGLPGVIIAIARPNWKVVIVRLLCCSTLQIVPCRTQEHMCQCIHVSMQVLPSVMLCKLCIKTCQAATALCSILRPAESMLSS